MERLVAVSDKEWLTDEDLPYEFHMARIETTSLPSSNLLDEAVSTFERNYILRALEKAGWSVSATAQVPRHSAQHAEVQDSEVRHPGVRAEDPGRVVRDNPAHAAPGPGKRKGGHPPGQPKLTKLPGSEDRSA
jgi:hypothetical protein